MAITSTISKDSLPNGKAAWFTGRFSAVLADYPSAGFLTGYTTPPQIFPEPCQVWATEKIKDANVKIQVSKSDPRQIEAGIAVWSDLTVDSGGAGTNTKVGKDQTGFVNGFRLYFAAAAAASTYDAWVFGVPAAAIDDGLFFPTPEGGQAQVFLSDIGADSVRGYVLTPGAVAGSMKRTPTSGKEVGGVCLVSGVPTTGYILVNPLIGIGPVLLTGATAAVLGHIMTTSTATAGRGTSIAAPAPYTAPDVVMRFGYPLVADAGGADVVINCQLGR